MSALVNSRPFPVHPPNFHARISPSRPGGRKRKADDEYDSRISPDVESMDAQMSSVPTSGNVSRNVGTSNRVNKRIRSSVTSRPLPLPRVLETLDAPTLRTMLRTLSERHPGLTSEICSVAPRPTVASALSSLNSYEVAYQQAFPYGGNSSGDYAYNRVRPALMELLDALSDYTPHFLPPNESLAATSLSFLDGATEIIHRLPQWENPVHNHSKQLAYEEITKAWILVVQEASKRGAGISLQYGGWDVKLAKHDEQSNSKMHAALVQMREAVGWMGDSTNNGRSPRLGGLGFGVHAGFGVPVRTW